MFKRVMVAVVGLPLLILILGWAPSWATMLLLAAMCAIGAWELMRAAAGERGKPLTPLTVIAAAAVPVCVYGEMSIENTELTALPVLPFAPCWARCSSLRSLPWLSTGMTRSRASPLPLSPALSSPGWRSP